MGRGQGQLNWGPGRVRPEGSGLGVDNRLPSASVWAVHWAAPALKVTFTGTPGYGPDFAHGVRGRAVTADTRAQDRGDTCAHTRFDFRVRRRRRRMESAAPPPSAPLLGEPSGLGTLTLGGPASFWSFLSWTFLCGRAAAE